jgi:uncharacterized protein YdcH (DUF465 family)
MDNPRQYWEDSFLVRWFNENIARGDTLELRVCLVLHEITVGTPIFSQVGASLLKATPYNVFHVSLMISDANVDWYFYNESLSNHMNLTCNIHRRDCSLTYPRKRRDDDRKPLISLDIGAITVERVGNKFNSPAIDEVNNFSCCNGRYIDAHFSIQLCEGMRIWNFTKEYSHLTNNSAHFYADMIDRIRKVEKKIGNAESKHDKAIDIFLQRVKEGKIEKAITKEMVSFPLKDLNNKLVDELIFETHAQLDNWTEKLKIDQKLSTMRAFKEAFPVLYKLLKAFDRAFIFDRHELSFKLDRSLKKLLFYLQIPGPSKELIDQSQEEVEFLQKCLQSCTRGDICPFRRRH